MKKTAVKGTRDYLPYQAEIREFMERTMLECYRNYGFRRIITPAIEDIENLDKSDGGENLNLIFKILKRGDKLNKAIENGGNICDMGLRYDLTLPLTRYIAANRQYLAMPFKCIQIDKVYRAEKPQKSRLREFMQCDIDIIGDNSCDCEIELITVTAEALLRLGIYNFDVRINDRKILNALLLKVGFSEEQLSSVCISFDKLDKIGSDGVIDELISKGFDSAVISNFSELLIKLPMTLLEISQFVGYDKIDNLNKIISQCQTLARDRYTITFDVSLVRGQGYYTGTIFEVVCENSSGAVAGGGRYDNLIGKFTGENISACGFSIGFEPIYNILIEMNKPINNQEKLVVLYNDDFTYAFKKADDLRDKYDVSLYRKPKNMKSFLDKIKTDGYIGFAYDDGEIRRF